MRLRYARLMVVSVVYIFYGWCSYGLVVFYEMEDVVCSVGFLDLCVLRKYYLVRFCGVRLDVRSGGDLPLGFDVG